MIVTLDVNLTTYEFRKNCKIKIRKIYKDGVEQYLFEYGFTNRIAPHFTIWSSALSDYLAKRVGTLYTYVGFDRNVSQSDVINTLNMIKRYIIYHAKDK